MATKQLSTLNPRNFKEKIELLKRKEAASTANFAAAIRDACEIRQIAVAYDLGRLKPLNAESTCLPLGKTFSLPNIKSSSSTNLRLAPSPTELTTGKTENAASEVLPDVQNEQASNTSTAVPHPFPPLSAALTPRLHTSTDERPSALLSTTCPNFVSSNPQANNALSPRSYKLPGYHSLETIHHQLSYTETFHPTSNVRRSQAMRHCSGPMQLSCDRSPVDCAAAFKSERRQWSATAPKSNVSSHPNLATGRPLAHSLQLPPSRQSVEDDNHIGGSAVITNPPYNTFDPHASINYSPNAHIHSTPSPHGNAANFRSHNFFPQDFYNHPTNPLPSGVGAANSENTELMTASQLAPLVVPRVPPTSIDWRRVSSDSSICTSLAAYHSTPRDPHSAYLYDTQLTSPPRPVTSVLPHAHSATRFGCGYPAAAGTKKPESLRRHFPTNPIASSAMYAVNSSTRPPDHFPFSCVEHHRSSEEQHLLPPKRPFTSSYKVAPLCLTNATGHKYFGMNNLTLEGSTQNGDTLADAASVSTKFAAQHCPSASAKTGIGDNHSAFQHVDPVQPLSGLSAVSTPNIVAQHTVPPWSNGIANAALPHPTRITNSPLPLELSSCDPVALDRCLQIPEALLDLDDGSSKWTGRRDSCTMTAEVLSALSTMRSASPAFPLVKTPGVDTPPTTVPGPTKAVDPPAYNNLLPTLTESQDEYGSGEHFSRSTPRTNLRRSGFQTVADQLGISITSKDYELLTDPQLVNYVTDETTEAQLLN
ncbi:unnamed protein product [Dicrocoelium dendriticum]|nr:unnamed protein product [Dicrocoelium dendriticum]